MFCVGFVIISKTKCKDILLMFMSTMLKKNITKMYACILILYFETYGFKYVERIASKDVAVRSDRS